MPSPFESLTPRQVWRHFDTLCRIPRKSKHEDAIRSEIATWASARGLHVQKDGAGNLIIRKNASPGREGAPAIALQAHLDMVCQQTAGHDHDFLRDPIRPVLKDGWVIAEHTTLGADNGMGVALILAALEEGNLAHGPLEALLTVDEEDGMGGASGLKPGTLQSQLMLNLDTEEWGQFYLGCAGGLDVNADQRIEPDPVPAGWDGWRISVGGLRGGHSGIDIHEGRANAIKLLLRVLTEIDAVLPVRLASMSGGNARNAIPRDAEAVLAAPPNAAAALASAVGQWMSVLRSAFTDTDPGLQLAVNPAPVVSLLPHVDQLRWLRALHAAPYGPSRMSDELPGVVDTSNNLGLVSLTPNRGHCNFMVRSLRAEGARELAGGIANLMTAAGIPTSLSGEYPGWTPRPESALLARCQEVQARLFGAAATVHVIHAGLECGLILGTHPDLDIVSLGPTIRGAHAPGEAVDIQSVAKTWALLCGILEAVPETPGA